MNHDKSKKYYYSSGELLSEVEYAQNGLKDGQLREYYKTGELKSLEYYKNGQLVDTTFGYYKSGSISVKRYNADDQELLEKYYVNGKLEAKGVLIDTIKTGWWSYYDEEGHLTWRVEYVDASNDSSISNSEHPNQLISFNANKKIDNAKSNYISIDLADTIRAGKLTLGAIGLVPQVSKEANFHMVYFWVEDSEGREIQVDSTYGTNIKKAQLWVVPKTEGDHQLRGYVLEKGHRFEEIKNDTTMVNYIETTKKIFFKKKFYARQMNEEQTTANNGYNSSLQKEPQ